MRYCHNCNNSVFNAYDKPGWKNTTISCGDFRVIIRANFGYQGASYLQATIEKGGRLILDFSLDKLYVLNNSSVSAFSAKTEYLESLFPKIESACKFVDYGLNESVALAYLQ